MFHGNELVNMPMYSMQHSYPNLIRIHKLWYWIPIAWGQFVSKRFLVNVYHQTRNGAKEEQFK